MGSDRPIAAAHAPRGRVALLTLQRLGDLITGAHVASELARRAEVEAIELVHFSPTEQAARLLPGISIRHALDYNALKQLRHLHPFAAATRLSARLEEIRGAHGFDTVVNLSSTRFACAIGPTLLNAGGTMLGPQLDDRGQFLTDDPFSQHINDFGVDAGLNVFAHQDLYAAAASVAPGACTLPTGSSRARHEARRALAPLAGRTELPLAMHLHSSDLRKDWGDASSLSRWRGLVQAIGERSDRGVVLLGHPRERPVLQALAEACPTRSTVATCPIDTTAEILRRCAGLISVDTVSIHLAALVGCRSVVLRLGPAGGMAFAPGEGALLIDPRSDCYPCERTQCTSAPIHACHHDLHVGDLVDLCQVHLLGRPLSALASRRICARVRVRVCQTDDLGLRQLVTPQWLPAGVADRRADLSDAAWRRAWWLSWTHPEATDDRLVWQLASPTTAAGKARLERLMAGDSLLARKLGPIVESQRVGA
ncbi:MAG: hypothetical protein V3V08_15215 [Nannocystaceae bacterium]